MTIILILIKTADVLNAIQKLFIFALVGQRIVWIYIKNRSSKAIRIHSICCIGRLVGVGCVSLKLSPFSKSGKIFAILLTSLDSVGCIHPFVNLVVI